MTAPQPSPTPHNPIRLDRYDNAWFQPGRSNLWRAAWLWLGLPLFRCSLLPFSGMRVALLRMFGAKVGQGVVIHSEAVVKYPWNLVVGDHCWLGERCWIDNLTTITLENHVCISQGVYLCTGNHDWSDPVFGLRVSPIVLREGSWAGARSTLLPGTVLEAGAVAGAGSVVSGTVPAFQVYSGNPASFARARKLVSQDPHSSKKDVLSKDDQPFLSSQRTSIEHSYSPSPFPLEQEASPQ